MLFAPPKVIETTVFARLPDEFQTSDRTNEWVVTQPVGSPHRSLLEGPSFDREGNLWCVNIPGGQVFKVTSEGVFKLVAKYDGWPNGLKIHPDGRVFIADYKHGIMVLEPNGGRVEPWLTHCFSESFKGVNDLTFALNGDLYFTDQGQTGSHDPTGRVYRVATDGRIDCLINNGNSPNGIVLDPHDKVLFVAMTRANCMWHAPLKPGGGIAKVGVFAMLPGMHGPDGLAMDEQGNLAVAHPRVGIIWLFNSIGAPLLQIHSASKTSRMTNMAYGGPDRKTLYIVDSYAGRVLKAPMPVAGKLLYSLL